MPSADEAGTLITTALTLGVDLVYQNPGCPAVAAMGGAYVQTHNSPMPGQVTSTPRALVSAACVTSKTGAA